MRGNISEKYFAHAGRPIPVQVVGTEGSHYLGADGKKYIDFVSGWNVGNLGWGNENLRKAIAKPRRPDYVPSHFHYAPWEKLASMLAEIAPGDLKQVFRTTGGTESVDGAMQIAMTYTGRSGFLSIEGGYHGNSIATLSIGDSKTAKQYKNLLPNCHKLEPPLDRHAIKKLETLLKKKDIAAFIMEPIIINANVLVPEPEFMAAVQALCKKYGTLMVMDEVACGFGRTGRLFASEHYDLKPDIMCLGKAITGGYASMGAILTTAKISRKIKSKIHLYSTFGWHPVSVDVAIANLHDWQQNKSQFLENTLLIEAICLSRLGEMKFKTDATFHSKGLAFGIDVKGKAYAHKIAVACLKNGLIVTPEENYICMFPPLTISENTAMKAMDILEKSL